MSLINSATIGRSSNKKNLPTDYFIGAVVEDNAPGKHKGQVRVRVLGVHARIPNDHLPWAVIMRPVSQFNKTVVPKIGDNVVVVFHKGDIYAPIVLGTISNSENMSGGSYPTEEGSSAPDGTSWGFDHKSKKMRINHSSGTKISISSSGDVEIDSSGNVSIQSSGTTDIDSTGPVTISAPLIEMAAK